MLWTKIHKLLKENDQIPSLDDVWDAAQLAWSDISSVDIEVLFRTLHVRMEQVIQCNGRNDMAIPHSGVREQVEIEDFALKNTSIAL